LRNHDPRLQTKRNGTATLFAALNTLDGTVISMCDDRHRHQEWLKFLRVIDEVTPDGQQIHLIADNYATHKHPKVQKWLARHPRFHIYFTPTGSLWLNMAERFFRDLTQNRLRRGIFRDVEELIMAIGEYIDKHNDNPEPFIWTAKAADILEKGQACPQVTPYWLICLPHYTRWQEAVGVERRNVRHDEMISTHTRSAA
jgi:transposase